MMNQITTENLIDNIEQKEFRFILKRIGMSVTKFVKSDIVQNQNIFSESVIAAWHTGNQKCYTGLIPLELSRLLLEAFGADMLTIARRDFAKENGITNVFNPNGEQKQKYRR